MIGYPSYEQIVALHDGLIVSFDGSAAMRYDAGNEPTFDFFMPAGYSKARAERLVTHLNCDKLIVQIANLFRRVDVIRGAK